jgi:uncharacterized BrkB/YihY/UPF0761 family membrane protein
VWINLSSRFILFAAAWTATRRVILQADQQADQQADAQADQEADAKETDGGADTETGAAGS